MPRIRTAHTSLLVALLLPGWATAAGLNDTGITQCSNLTQSGQTCPQTGFPRQDAETGRDAQIGLQKVGGGSAGFDFTKLGSNGNPLDASATNWDCVRDNVTGLIWEIKTNDNGLRDKDWTYTWYNPDPATNGGDAGSAGDATCGGFLSDQCNTQAYAAAVNALNPALCGYTDWRLPTREELLTIMDYSRYDPTIDTAYFPEVIPYAITYFWSSSLSASSLDIGQAWSVGFFNGQAIPMTKDNHDQVVRLVRGGE